MSADIPAASGAYVPPAGGAPGPYSAATPYAGGGVSQPGGVARSGPQAMSQPPAEPHQQSAQQHAAQQQAAQQHAAHQHAAQQYAAQQRAAQQQAAQPASPSSSSSAAIPPSVAQVVTGSAPVRSPLRTGTQAVGHGADAGEKENKGFLARFVRRDKDEGADGRSGGTGQARVAGGPRRVRAMLTRVDPLSIMKLAFLLSVASGIILVVATAVVWTVLDKMGVFVNINDQIAQMFGSESKVTLLKFFDRNKDMSAAILLAVVNSFLMTGLATIGAILYNLVAKVVGGVYVTLTDE